MSLSTKSSSIVSYINTVNFTKQSIESGYAYNKFSTPIENNKIILFLTNLHILGTIQQTNTPPFNPVSLVINASPINEQFYEINVQFGIQAKLNKLKFSIIIFDQQNILNSHKYFLIYEKIYFSSAGGFIQIPQQFFDNMMIGLTDFSSIKTRSIIKFKLDFVAEEAGNWGINMPVSTITTQVPVQNYGFTLLYLKTWLCSNDTYLNTTSNLCQSCDVLNCIECLYLTYCKLCDAWNGFLPIANDGQCYQSPPLCGDNYRHRTQECDDGNLNNRDGCSQQCLVQSDYQCLWNPDTNYLNSVCYYIRPIQIRVLYIQKADMANQIQILLFLTPRNQQLWNNIDFSHIITFTQFSGYQSHKIIHNKDNTVSIYLKYNKNIHNQTINFTFNPKLSHKISLANIIPIQISIPIIPNDNQMAYFYDQYVYQIAMTVFIFINIVAILAFLLFIFGLYAGKLVGVQMMDVFQISYLTLLTFPQFNPCFKALGSMWYVNGLNYYILAQNRKYLLDQYTDKQIKGLPLYSQFFQNYNFTFLFILGPCIISLIFYVLSRCTHKIAWKNKQKFLLLSKKMLFQYVFCGLMFSGYIFSVSFVLQFAYGIKNIINPIGIISIVQCIILCLLYLFYFVYIAKNPVHFGSFPQQLRNPDFKATILVPTQAPNEKGQILCVKYQQVQAHDKQNGKFYNLLMFVRIFMGCWLVFLHNNQASMIFLIILIIFPCIINWFKMLYIRKWYNLRFICNGIISSIIIIIYLGYKFASVQDTNTRIVWFILPIFICLLLLFCVTYNGYLMINNFILDRRKKIQEKIQKKQDCQNYQQEFSNYFGKQMQRLANNDHSFTARGFTSIHPQKFPSSVRNINVNLSQIKNEIKKQSILKLNDQHQQQSAVDRNGNQIMKETLSGYSQI